MIKAYNKNINEKKTKLNIKTKKEQIKYKINRYNKSRKNKTIYIFI